MDFTQANTRYEKKDYSLTPMTKQTEFYCNFTL